MFTKYVVNWFVCLSIMSKGCETKTSQQNILYRDIQKHPKHPTSFQRKDGRSILHEYETARQGNI